MRFPVNDINIRRGVGSHKGIDFGWSKRLGKNQPVYATFDGEIIAIQKQVTGGNVIHIKHNNGYVSEYGHLKDKSIVVKLNQKVRMGERIALMGNTGAALGNHLHYGLYKGTKINYKDKSKFVDGLKYLCKYSDQKICEESRIKNLHKTKKVVNCDELNIRNKPNTKGKIVGKVKKGQQVESFGTKQGWNIVDNIKDYYCSNKYVK